MIVTDSNVLVCLTVRSELSALAEAVYAVDVQWAVPQLWVSEFRNTLVKYIQHRGMTMESALLSLRSAEEIVSGREYTVASEIVFELAKCSGCSAYDCEYVALARDLGVPLVTADKQILREFPKTAVSLEQFIKKKK